MIKLRTKLGVSLGAVLLLSAAIPIEALAQAYPTKPVSFRVAYPAGGPADVATRKLQPSIQAGLGYPVVVENFPGASGSIAARNVLAAPADGHVVLVTTGNDAILAPLSNVSAKYRASELRLIANIFPTDVALVSSARHSFSGVDAFVRAARTRSTGEYSVGSWGYGSITYLVSADFQARTNVKLLDVPYKGAAPVIQALLSQEIDVAFVPLAANVLALVKSGQIKVIGVASKKRNPYLPDAPTLNEEAGLKDFSYTAWAGVFVPSNVPRAIAEKLSQQVNSALSTQSFKQFVVESAALPAEPMGLSAAEEFYTSEMKKYGAIAKKIDLKPQ